MAPRPSLEHLPPELICTILSEVDDVRTLQSAILSCRRLYDPFSGNANAIIIRVVLNRLDTWDLRPEALIAWQVSKLPVMRTAALIRRFYEQQLAEREVDRDVSSLTVDNALAIFKLQLTVEKLAKSFTEHCVEKLSYQCASAAPLVMPTSAAEKGRIMRALYRYEMFCTLFRLPEEGVERHREMISLSNEISPCAPEFFTYFSPWENEQVYCIYEFMFFKIAPAFNEMAKHDIAWGSRRVEPASYPNSSDSRHIYFRGLDALVRISEADTYERISETLGHIEMGNYYRYNFASSFSKSTALRGRRLPAGVEPDETIGHHRDAHAYASVFGPPFCEDPDDGPFKVWNWAHKENSLDDCYTLFGAKRLQEWGYTLWDKERLDALGTMQRPFRPWRHLDEFRLPSDQITFAWGLYYHKEGWKWSESWVARMKIWEDGGSGWWDFDDESKVVWKKEYTEDLERVLLLEESESL